MTIALGNSSWTPRALGVLERACDYAGGFETWRALRTIRLFPEALSGLVPWLKGNGTRFSFRGAFEIRPHQRWARFLNYPDAAHIGIFDDGAVRLEHCETKQTVLSADNHRPSFGGIAAYRRWTPLDALYFFGYALTHYHSLPFSLFDATLIRSQELGAQSDRLSVLEVELPADLPTHCRRQSFYFDRAGRLVRHDYHAEIIGFWARGAHFWKRAVSVGGFPICLERHVFARLGVRVFPLTALHARFVSAEVEWGAPPSA
jgi:hypothetical protein